MAIFTVGHSTLEKKEFVKLLKDNRVEVLLDVRSHPTSRWVRFQREFMRVWVPQMAKAQYIWQPDLGGWTAADIGLQDEMAKVGVNVSAYARGAFPKQRIGVDRADIHDPSWTNQGLYDYAWYTGLPKFQAAARTLMELGTVCDVAIMCAEVLWWKCHRSMIADWLVAHGSDATHLQPRPIRHSEVIGNRLERYPASVQKAWRMRPGLIGPTNQEVSQCVLQTTKTRRKSPGPKGQAAS